MKKFIILIFVFISFYKGYTQDAQSVYVNSLLGAGVNGYKIIANGIPNWPSSYYIGLKAAGFSSVRIVFEANLSGNDVTSESLVTLRTIIDECLSAGLIPVLDYHYTQWDTYTTEKGAIFVVDWAAIASVFDDYAYDELVFELSNEPNTVSAAIWNTLASDLVTAIRGQDADRIIMLSPLVYGHIEGLSTFVLPDDDKLILSIHYYNPIWMVYQGCTWVGDMNGLPYVGTHWQNIQPMIDNLEEEFKPVFNFQAANNNIPVCIGEWGTVIYADSLSRIKYYTLLARWFEQKGFSHQVWEYNDWFGIMRNPSLGVTSLTGFYPGLAEAITSTPLLLDSYTSTTIIEDTFNTVGGWTTYYTGGANVSISASSQQLAVNVISADAYAENARVWSPLFDLMKDSIYRLTYTVRTVSGVKYIAHKYSGYHDWYDIYNLGTTNTTIRETYIMPTATQVNAKVEFIVGAGTEDIYISDFKLERLTVHPYSAEVEESDTLFFKNYISGNNVDVVWNADCADSTVTRYLTGTGGTVTDTIAKVNFATNDGWWDVGATGWTRFNDGVDSLLISPNIYLINSPVEMSFNYSGEITTIVPPRVSESLWYLPTSDNDPREFHIRGAGLSTDYTYTLLVFSSRAAGVSTPRSTYLYVGAAGDTVESVGNTSTMLSVSNITATSNNITFSLDRINGQYGYINGLILLRSQTLINDTTQSWIYHNNVNFGDGLDSIRYAVDFNQSVGEKSFELRLDNSTGTLIDSFVVDAPGCGIRAADLSSEVTGVHDLYVMIDTLDQYDWLVFYKKEVATTSRVLSDTFYLQEADVFNNNADIQYSSACSDSVGYITTYSHYGNYFVFNNVYCDFVPNRIKIKSTFISGSNEESIFSIAGDSWFMAYTDTSSNSGCSITDIVISEEPSYGDYIVGETETVTINLNMSRTTKIAWVYFYYVPEDRYFIKNDGINYSISNKRIMN